MGRQTGTQPDNLKATLIKIELDRYTARLLEKNRQLYSQTAGKRSELRTVKLASKTDRSLTPASLPFCNNTIKKISITPHLYFNF